MNTLSNTANPELQNKMLIEEIENLKLQRSQHHSTYDPLLGFSNNLELTQLDVLTW